MSQTSPSASKGQLHEGSDMSRAHQESASVVRDFFKSGWSAGAFLDKWSEGGPSRIKRHAGVPLDDARKLLNRLDDLNVNPFQSLLEVSMTVGHPFNALYLHDCLRKWKMPERDSHWTHWINWACLEESSGIEGIISWGLSARDRSVDVSLLNLVSVTLSWFLSSSHMKLRDRATKALATVFLADSSVFSFALEKMGDCDDPYIVERLYAAAFGACCIDQNPDRLKFCSLEVFKKVFANGQPPVALLTRDYALGIIELARSKGALDSAVKLKNCYHPFNSDAPEFDLTEEEVKKVADERGDREIFMSAAGELGDYGRYTIPGAVQGFLATRLSQPKPQKRLHVGMRSEEYDRVDEKQCRLWVTRRAYELGWSSELFPEDRPIVDHSIHENDFERIGKKYQRIALDEIQARLADNFWSLGDCSEEPFAYRYSNYGFRRNLEPTILPTDSRLRTGNISDYGWIVKPIVDLPEVEEENLGEWLFEKDPTMSTDRDIMRTDKEGKTWLSLYAFNRDKKKDQNPKIGEYGIRYEEFRFLYCVFVKRGKAAEFAKFLEGKKNLEVQWFHPENFVGQPYLREAYWRDVWQDERVPESLSNAPDGCDFEIPVCSYHWESHLDRSLPTGFSCYLPKKWFADDLGLLMSEDGAQAWVDKIGNVAIQTQTLLEDQTAVVINEDVLHSYARKFQVDPIWLMIFERRAWPKAIKGEIFWRRSEGVAWLDGESWKKIGWNHDKGL